MMEPIGRRVVLLLLMLPFMSGATCSGSAPAAAPPATPPRTPPPPASIYVSDHTQYFLDSRCGLQSTHFFDPTLNGLAAAAGVDGWRATTHDNLSGRPEYWIDRSAPICASVPDVCTTFDGNNGGESGADDALVSAFSGHGAIPDRQRGTFLLGYLPHQTILFSQPSVTTYPPNSPTGTPWTQCGPRLSSSRDRNGNFYPGIRDTLLGAGSGGKNSHLILHSSCSGQPRLMDNFTLMGSRTSQVFGWLYSPVDVAKPANYLTQFWLDTQTMGNTRSWLHNMQAFNADVGGTHAGAVVHTIATAGQPAEAFSMDSNSPPSALPSAIVHAFRRGQQLTRQLPPGPTDVAYDVSNERYSVVLDLCRRPAFDLCGNPDPTVCGSGNPLVGEPMKVLGYSNVSSPTSSVPAIGVKIPLLRFKRRIRNVDELTVQFAAAAEALVGRRFDKAVFDTGIRENIASGRWTMNYAGEGVAFGYDPIRGRARLANMSPNDVLDPGGNPVMISGSAAGAVIEQWLNQLQTAGLPRAGDWTVEHPEGTEVYETDPNGGFRVWAYSYTIRRQINGFPVMAQSMTIWIHRSGKVAYLESMLPGLPVEEAWELFRDAVVGVPFSVAKRAAIDMIKNKYGVPAVVTESWVGYQRSGPLPSADQAEASVEFRPHYYFRVIPQDEWIALRPAVVTVPVEGEPTAAYAQ